MRPSEVLIISFTVKAAKEAAMRLAKLGLPGVEKQVKVRGLGHCYPYVLEWVPPRVGGGVA